METFELTSTVTFIVEAESENEAIDQITDTLSDVAYDWTCIQ